MTFRDLVQLAADNSWIPIGFLSAVPLLAYLFSLLHGKGRGAQAPWRYLYAVLIYATCFIGVFACLLIGYTLFFTSESLLDVNLIIYLLPVVSMVITLILIRRNVAFDEIPGFDRLSGLMTIIAITFCLALAVQKTRIWLFFGSSIFTLAVLVAVLFVVLKWSANLAFSRSRSARD